MRSALSLFLTLLLVVALPAARPSHADEQGAEQDDEQGDGAKIDADAFESGLKRLHGYDEPGRHAAGVKELRRLLEEHARQPWARGYRAEVEDLAERLVFGAAYPAPEPRDVIRGRLERYDAARGQVRIRYSARKTGELKQDADGFWRFPTRVRGSFVLEVSGSAYPKAFDQAPLIELAGELQPETNQRETWWIGFGSPAREENGRQSWLPARITHAQGGSSKTVSEVAESPARVGQRYVLKLKVSKARMEATLNKKLVGKAKKSTASSEALRFRAPDWTSLVFSGTVDPAWIQGRIDLVVQGQREAFLRTYDRSGHLPAWLFTPPLGMVSPKGPDFPVPLATRFHADARAFVSALRQRSFQDAGRFVAAMGVAGAPATVLDYFRARLAEQEGKFEAGLAAVERVLEAEPGFLPARLLQGKLLGELHRGSDALAAFELALAAQGTDPRVFEITIGSLLGSGALEDAHQVSGVAARSGVVSDRLDRLARIVRKARLGPRWSRRFHHRSRGYDVFSDMDTQTCVEAAGFLEQALAAYKTTFHWVGRATEKHYRVYVFGGKAGFLRYWKDLEEFLGHPPEFAAGVYIPHLQQLLIWHQGDRENQLETLRHEGFHQYLDRLLQDVPVWLNEGLAVYHEAGRVERGRLRFGQVQPERVALLRKAGLRPMAAFIRLTPEQFYSGQEAFRNYAQAWAFIHLLKQGAAQHRALLKSLIEALQGGSGAEALAALLPPERLRELDAELRSHLARMR